MKTCEIAEFAFDSHAVRYSLDNYQAILTLHGLARLAVLTADPRLVDKARAQLLPFVRGEHELRSGNFQNYRCGGNGTALMLWKGYLPEAAATVAEFANDLMTAAPRSAEGIFCMPGGPHPGGIWIDTAFAVTPFLLFAGLAHGREDWITEACEQTLKMMDLFRDPANGLLHQSRGFRGPGLFSEDHWSRGNGWGMLAISELGNYLPASHPLRPRVDAAFTGLLEACLRVQDANGMWHQELTVAESYEESSGTGLILYGLGVGLEKGLIAARHRADLLRGLRAYTGYFTATGDVFHTCRGCLCPGEGRMIDYMARPAGRNDSHGYGPLVMAFGQACHLGIDKLEE